MLAQLMIGDVWQTAHQATCHGVDAPQLTRLNMFGTPLMIATLPEARPYCGTRERISIAINFGLANVWS